MKHYSINQLAKLAGISVKTLHHYDSLGLLRPERHETNGYRTYTHQDLVKLMHILFYRELEFPLAKIKDLISQQSDDRAQFKAQLELLKQKQSRLDRLHQTLSLIITSLETGDTMSNTTIKAHFNDLKQAEYQAEAKARWGHTDAYQQSVQRTKSWTKAEWQQVKAEASELTQSLAQAMDLGKAHPSVQALIKKHHQHLNRFYECSKEMYLLLGEMYFVDKRFAATYEQVKPGLAKFMSEAITVYCQSK